MSPRLRARSNARKKTPFETKTPFKKKKKTDAQCAHFALACTRWVQKPRSVHCALNFREIREPDSGPQRCTRWSDRGFRARVVISIDHLR